MKRPVGVTIVAAVFTGYALVVLFSIVWALQNPDKVQSWSGTAPGAATIASEIAIFAPIRMAMSGLVAYGLWTLKEWARKGALCCIAFVVVKQLASLTGVRKGGAKFEIFQSASANWISVAVLLGIAAYLAIPAVYGHFSQNVEGA